YHNGNDNFPLFGGQGQLNEEINRGELMISISQQLGLYNINQDCFLDIIGLFDKYNEACEMVQKFQQENEALRLESS
ncbi:4062_t:CDS:2, partial [Funneliformis geosporum]